MMAGGSAGFGQVIVTYKERFTNTFCVLQEQADMDQRDDGRGVGGVLSGHRDDTNGTAQDTATGCWEKW